MNLFAKCSIVLLIFGVQVYGLIGQPFSDGQHVKITAEWNNKFLKKRTWGKSYIITHAEAQVFRVRKFPDEFVGFESLNETGKYITKAVSSLYLLPFSDPKSLFKIYPSISGAADSYALQNKENNRFVGRHSQKYPNFLSAIYSKQQPPFTSFKIKPTGTASEDKPR